MNLRQATEKIREAKRIERKLGTTFYKVVTDTNTGDRKIVPVYQHGMPSSFESFFSLPDTGAMLTGVASTLALFHSGKTMQKAMVGNEKINRKQKRNATLLGLTGVAGLISLSPMSVRIGSSNFGIDGSGSDGAAGPFY